MTRTWAAGLCLALLALTAACGGDEGETAAAPTEDTMAQPSAGAADGGAADGGDVEVLTGTVGTPDNPDAFEITLTDASGEEVTEVPAGDYEIRVSDLSEIHNFHLMGEGVDEATTVPETGDVVWEVTLEEGDYEYICDPHPGMRGELTVT